MGLFKSLKKQWAEAREEARRSAEERKRWDSISLNNQLFVNKKFFGPGYKAYGHNKKLLYKIIGTRFSIRRPMFRLLNPEGYDVAKAVWEKDEVTGEYRYAIYVGTALTNKVEQSSAHRDSLFVRGADLTIEPSYAMDKYYVVDGNRSLKMRIFHGYGAKKRSYLVEYNDHRPFGNIDIETMAILLAMIVQLKNKNSDRQSAKENLKSSLTADNIQRIATAAAVGVAAVLVGLVAYFIGYKLLELGFSVFPKVPLINKLFTPRSEVVIFRPLLGVIPATLAGICAQALLDAGKQRSKWPLYLICIIVCAAVIMQPILARNFTVFEGFRCVFWVVEAVSFITEVDYFV